MHGLRAGAHRSSQPASTVIGTASPPQRSDEATQVSSPDADPPRIAVTRRVASATLAANSASLATRSECKDPIESVDPGSIPFETAGAAEIPMAGDSGSDRFQKVAVCPNDGGDSPGEIHGRNRSGRHH